MNYLIWIVFFCETLTQLQGKDFCTLQGKIVPYLSLPKNAGFVVYVYRGKVDKRDETVLVRSINVNGDYTFGDIFEIPPKTESLTLWFLLQNGPKVVFREENTSLPCADHMSVKTHVYAATEDSVSLRNKAAALAKTNLEAALWLFDEAATIGETAGQNLEAIRVKARTLAAVEKSPAKALEAISEGASLYSFGKLPPKVRQSYWTERHDYLENTAMKLGYSRDTNGSFASAIIQDPKLSAAWTSFVTEFDKAPPTKTVTGAVALSKLPTISEQDRAIRAFLPAISEK